MRRLFLGIDIGTTGAKAVLLDTDGAVIADAFADYPMHVSGPGRAEQDPDDWWRATVAVSRELVAAAGPESIAGVGLTGQMHGLVLTGADGRPLRRCIMWNDQRTARQCEEITGKIGAERLVELTGKPALTGFTAGKLLWVRDNEPETYRRTRHVMLPKDYVRFCLTGAVATDVADASGTNLLDLRQRAWSEEIVSRLAIPQDWLPAVHECQQVVGEVSLAVAAETGLPAGVPVVAGAGDQAAQSLGTGIVDEGTVSVTVGTSGVVFAAANRYRYDREGRVHAYCHAAPERWHLMGVTLAAGGSVRWLRDILGGSYEELDAMAAAVPAGSEDLFYLPYLSGERSPYPDPDARGVFFGLSYRHGRGHLFRSVLEGVAFSLKDCLDMLCEFELSCRRIRVSGGGSRSALWRQIMADVFDADIVGVNVAQGACYGAALLAAVGTGAFGSVREACARAVRETGVTRPGISAESYRRRHARYRSLYPALRPEFAALARMASD